MLEAAVAVAAMPPGLGEQRFRLCGGLVFTGSKERVARFFQRALAVRQARVIHRLRAAEQKLRLGVTDEPDRLAVEAGSRRKRVEAEGTVARLAQRPARALSER